MVPSTYLINNDMYVVDVPGFAENDPAKRDVIQFLQKIFLTNVFKFGCDRLRLVCVVNVASLFDDNASSLLNNYHGALLSLFGEATYGDALQSITFLLTKNDRTEEEVESRMGELLMEFLDLGRSDVGMIAKLMQRMIKAHEFVNLDEDDNVTLMEKLQRLNQNASVPIRKRELVFESLEAGQNQLTANWQEYIRAMTHVLKNHETALEQFSKAWAEESAEISEATAGLAEGKETAVNEKSDAQASLQSLQARIDGFLEKLGLLQIRLDEAKAGRDIQKENLRVYRKNKGDVSEINVKCLRSHEKLHVPVVETVESLSARKAAKNRFINKKKPLSPEEAPPQPSFVPVRTHSIDVKIDLNVGNPKACFMIAVSQHGGVAAIESHLRRKNGMEGLLPKSLEDLRDLDGPEVFFVTEKKNIIKARCEDDPNEPGVKRFVVSDFEHPFSLFIFTEHAFDTTPFAHVLEQHYTGEVSAGETKVTKAEEAVEKFKSANIHNTQERKTLDAKLAELSRKIAEINEKTKTMQMDHRNKVATHTDKSSSAIVELKSVQGDSVLDLIREVLQVFTENRIDTTVGLSLQGIHEKVDSLLQRLASTERQLSRFIDDDDTALADVELLDVHLS